MVQSYVSAVFDLSQSLASHSDTIELSSSSLSWNRSARAFNTRFTKSSLCRGLSKRCFSSQSVRKGNACRGTGGSFNTGPWAASLPAADLSLDGLFAPARPKANGQPSAMLSAKLDTFPPRAASAGCPPSSLKYGNSRASVGQAILLLHANELSGRPCPARSHVDVHDESQWPCELQPVLS